MTNIISLNPRQEVLNDLGDFGSANFNVSPKSLYVRPTTIVPNKKALVNNDTGEVLSVVSDSYQIAQHPDTFRTVERIIADSDLDLTGVRRNIEVSHNGARAYARYTFPAHELETSRGDSSVLEILARNSFDGSWCFHIDIGAVRMACTNGQVILEDFAMYKSRHTKNLNMAHAAKKLSKSLEVYEKEVERWKEWKNIDIKNMEALRIFAQVANCKFITRELSYREQKIVEASFMAEPEVYRNKTLMKLWDHYMKYETAALGRNLWAVYNTLTHWATHAAAGKKTAEHNISAIKVRRQDKVREVFKRLDKAA